MRVSKRAIVAVAGVILSLSACSPSSNDTSTTTGTTASASPNASESRKAEKEREKVEAAELAEASASESAERKEAGAFNKKVEAQTSVNARLGMIVTEFCRVARYQSEYEHLSLGTLSGMFDSYWQAGRWNSPLREAVKQKGGCPNLADAPL